MNIALFPFVSGHGFTGRTLPAIFLLVGLLAFVVAPAPVAGAAGRIPVILDTDIGDDIDDTWALGFVLRSPELDLKLVVGDQGKTLYRARVLAKFLEQAGRTDVPVGIGLDRNATGDGPQAEWVKDYDLNRYPGKILPDGVRAIIDTIMKSEQRVTLVAIGPVPNIAAALRLEPAIARKARFVGMHGSVRVGYGGSKTVSPEYNVRADAPACRDVFTAPWDITITPLDTCGIVQLGGDRYRRLRQSRDPVATAIVENYRIWAAHQNPPNPGMADSKSSTLFDTVAVYLAFTTDRLKMEPLGIRVTDDGFTVIDAAAKMMSVATEWTDKEGFYDMLTDRLAGKAGSR